MLENIQELLIPVKKENTYMAFDIIDIQETLCFPRNLTEIWIYPKCAKNRNGASPRNFCIRIPILPDEFSETTTYEDLLTTIAIQTKKFEISPIEIIIEKFCKSFNRPIDKKLLIKYLSRWYANDLEKFKKLNNWAQNKLCEIQNERK